MIPAMFAPLKLFLMPRCSIGRMQKTVSRMSKRQRYTTVVFLNHFRCALVRCPCVNRRSEMLLQCFRALPRSPAEFPDAPMSV